MTRLIYILVLINVLLFIGNSLLSCTNESTEQRVKQQQEQKPKVASLHEIGIDSALVILNSNQGTTGFHAESKAKQGQLIKEFFFDGQKMFYVNTIQHEVLQDVLVSYHVEPSERKAIILDGNRYKVQLNFHWEKGRYCNSVIWTDKRSGRARSTLFVKRGKQN